jgi:NAD(P)-dependent dehydrogenase (short-subunit alcohol dehydrogenase family)
LESRYPGTKITPIEADAADEVAIQAVCEQAIVEEGRLDIFFANAGIVGANLLASTEPDEFMETFRVNTLR